VTLAGLVSVVVINFNSGEHIFHCIDSLQKQSYRNWELIIVDNASTDGSSEAVRQLAASSGFQYEYSEKNLGSSRGNNLGILLSHGEFVLVMNADVFLDPSYMANCIAAFTRDSRIGTVIGKLISSKDPRVIDSAGVTLFREGLGVERGIGEVDLGQYDRDEYVAGACCAAAMYRREMLEDIRIDQSFYDEQFFAFVEDLDLSVRALLRGWQTLYFPSAVARHVRGGSTKSSKFAQFLSYRNCEYFYHKTFRHFDPVSWILRTILNLIRLFTVERDFRIRAKLDFKKDRGELDKQRELILAGADYGNLYPFVRHSYIVANCGRRIRVGLGYRFREAAKES
jgi:GT2 family glycosyltransferase